jgi:hypothetical protein
MTGRGQAIDKSPSHHGSRQHLRSQEPPVAAGGPSGGRRGCDRQPKVRFGVLAGKLRIAADFDAPLPDEVSELVLRV